MSHSPISHRTQEKHQKEKESHASVIHSGGWGTQEIRINDAHDQKFSDNTHPRWGLPSGILNDHIFWSGFHRESRKGALGTVPMTWDPRFLKEMDGLARVLGEWQGMGCAFTQCQGEVKLTLFHSCVQGRILPGGSAGFSDMTCSWEKDAYLNPLNHHNNSERKWLWSLYYRWGKL